MNTTTHTRAGGDIATAYNLDTIFALIETKDILGAVLRVHFCLEEFLNIWCDKITHCNDFFDLGRGKFIMFDMKLAISKKLGLPAELAEVFTLFNRIRNKFAHQTNVSITDDELNSIRYAIDRISTYGSPIPKMDDPSWRGQFDEREVHWNMPNVSVIDKLLMIYFTFSMKAISVFNKELSDRGISFTYSD
ncbi:hypothetical protein [Acinetobacter bereziniae]|uniref:hypothetical protein n=1 Tax=Acinetobacter bereziniae TaxID=106648 RepID=UPI00124FFEAD|nr:hypothetical protein [Acinetobacter bereziniae]